MVPESAEALIELVSEKREVEVRYGRAHLTIARWGQLGEGPMWEAIRSYRQGRLTAEELSWAYVKRRVLSYSPSFQWAQADLDRVLGMVTECSESPTLPSLPSGEFAPALAAAAEAERVEREEGIERLMDAMRPKLNHLGLSGAGSGRPAWQKNLAAAIKAPGAIGTADIVETARKTIFGAAAASRPTTFGFGVATVRWPMAEDHFELLRGVLPPGREKLVEGIMESATAFSGTLGARYGADGKLLSDQIGSLSLGLNLTTSPAVEALRERFTGLSILGLDHLVGPESLLPDFGARQQIQQIADATRWREIGTKWIEFFERVLPRNWRTLDGEQTMKAGDLMKETGIGLAWAPREEIVIELIEAKGYAERCRILQARCEDVIADVEAVLDEIEDDDLIVTVEACRSAIIAFRTDLIGPAQSHLGTTLTDLAYRFFGDREFKGVRELFEDVNPRDDVGMTHYALYATGLGWVRVSVWIKNAGNNFNRHKTLHRLGDHHSTVQFLSALLLITSLAREFERAARRGELGERGAGRLLAG